MNPAAKKRSVNINGHKTSVCLEDEFWEEVLFLARKAKMTIGDYLLKISNAKLERQGLASAIRCAVLHEVMKGR